MRTAPVLEKAQHARKVAAAYIRRARTMLVLDTTTGEAGPSQLAWESFPFIMFGTHQGPSG